jgi:hypothetical protein
MRGLQAADWHERLTGVRLASHGSSIASPSAVRRCLLRGDGMLIALHGTTEKARSAPAEKSTLANARSDCQAHNRNGAAGRKRPTDACRRCSAISCRRLQGRWQTASLDAGVALRETRARRGLGTLCRAPTADRARHYSAVILTLHSQGLGFPVIFHKYGFTVLCQFGGVR